jgi:hypothetical protein
VLNDVNSTPLVVIATGQSNMLGHADDSLDTQGAKGNINPYVAHYEMYPTIAGQTKGWKTAGPGDADWAFFSTGNSIAYHFCDMLQRQTRRQVLLIMQAAGGRPIEEWFPGGGGYSVRDPELPIGNTMPATGFLYTQLLDSFNEAKTAPIPNRTDGKSLNDLNQLGADVLLFHQGESNNDANSIGTSAEGDAGRLYRIRFKRVIEFFRPRLPGDSQSGPDENIINYWTPVIIGELSRGNASTSDRNGDIRTIADQENLIGLATSHGLKTTSDGIHFTGEALVEFARRYFNAYNKISP